ncbi:Type IV secretory pathway, VirD2 components (relaxase) [Mesorhizobium albiziae]|uniref:Type IV secretory pathway, VirD2 components (Relaxase) n=1 Tax=Neomesorhizobium albiziae TaxID=335020 RepID=A0A1I4F5B7_9HYPH|nr:conjugal transfer protein TraI [Mesorhizobium albiziae]SFL12037.1 Type IV secretory pathway, VirD2 components (relaxase) [Mesorhizobium albiziae]
MRDDFEPKLGRMRATGSRRGRKYLHRVLRSANLARGGAAGGSRRGEAFHGNRIGRGAGVGRVLASRDRFAAFRQRRVIIKSRIVKLERKGLQAARAHLRYIQRDGVTRDGAPGQLYDADQDRTDGKAFIDRADGDRHQFRFIVSAEDGDQYRDLKPLVRRLMAHMEEDLATRLDWVAVDHHNTGHPHSHVIVRGKDERGRDLIIARDYLATGMRERAAEIVSLDLGPRSDLEIENRLRNDIDQERLTAIDRRLLRDREEDGLVSAADRDAFRQSLRAGRLQKLKRLGLADEVRPGQWRLADNLEDTLRRMGERSDIIKTMHRKMSEKGIARPVSDYAVYDPSEPGTRQIVGRVIARGLSDEINDRHYLIVDGVDGRSHYIDIGKGDAVEPISDNAIVHIEPKRAEARAVDHTVAEIAAANGGRYGVDIHLRHDPTASEAFAETHVRRLEAIRRATGGVERDADGTWKISPDHLDRAAAYENKMARAAPAVRALSPIPLDQLPTTDGATWLDRELVAGDPTPLRNAGFGRDVREAQTLRRQWLIANELAREEQGRIVYRANMLALLRRRELNCIAGQLSDELGLAYSETRPGARVDGIYSRPIDLASGRFAMIERSKEFTLVPWRPVLERHLGREVSGIAKGEGISWTIGRQRSGPSVS